VQSRPPRLGHLNKADIEFALDLLFGSSARLSADRNYSLRPQKQATLGFLGEFSQDGKGPVCPYICPCIRPVLMEFYQSFMGINYANVALY
jgi:hypothetical protein